MSLVRAALFNEPLQEQPGPVGQIAFEILQGPVHAPFAWSFVAVAVAFAGVVGVVRASVPSIVAIVSEPAGAEVVVDGASLGVTPLKLKKLTNGPHTVELKLSGYEAKSVHVQIEPFASDRYEAGLIAVPVKVEPAPLPKVAEVRVAMSDKRSSSKRRR